MIVLNVSGVPRPQPRPRFVAGRVVSTASRHAKFWRNCVIREARLALLKGRPPMAGDVDLTATFYFGTPVTKRHGEPHTVRPDVDNLVKLVMDALADAGVLPRGDATVARITASKLWGPSSGAVVELRPYGKTVAVEDDNDVGAVPLEP